MKCVDRLVLPWRPPLVAVLALLVMSRAGAGPAQAQQPGIFLAQGWSNVLYLGPSGPIATGLGWLGGEVSEVIIWDPENQRWHAYYPSVPQAGDLATLQFGQVYWFALQSPAVLPGAIAQPSPTEEFPGWNNVAYFGPGAAGSSLLEQNSVWEWDPTGQRWLHRDPASPASSDFQGLTPLGAYWVYVQPTSGSVATLPPSTAASSSAASSVPPKGGSCYPFTAVQPAIADVDSALLQAGLGGPAPDAQLAAPAERVGPTGSETVQPAYIPPTVLRGLGWVESSWHQATYATQRGQSGPTLTAGSCAYGILQIATGMAIAGNPTAAQQEIGSDFHSNIAAATQLITKYWNRDSSVMPYLGHHDPHIVEDWYFAVWAFNCYGTDCPSYGVHNDPDDPALPWPRPVYNSHDQLSSSTNLGFSDYPYQELVYGLVANPPTADGHLLWRGIPVQLPPHGSVGFPTPHAVPEASAHLEDGSAVVPSPSAAVAP
jgi:hypothetical protein